MADVIELENLRFLAADFHFQRLLLKQQIGIFAAEHRNRAIDGIP